MKRMTTLVFFTMVAMLAVLAPAGAAPKKVDPIQVALDRIEAGTWTQADIDTIKKVPEIAAVVPDPSVPATVEVTSSGPTTTVQADTPSFLAAAPVTLCGTWVDVWFGRTSILGNSIYRWHHFLKWCHNGVRVTAWQERYDYLSHTQSGVYARELYPNSNSGVGTFNATSTLGRHLEFCLVKYGCYENHYPRSTINVNANGNYNYSGSAG